MNNVVASDVLMDDIVNEMVTPGNIEDICDNSDDGNIGTNVSASDIKMNPLQEGGGGDNDNIDEEQLMTKGGPITKGETMSLNENDKEVDNINNNIIVDNDEEMIDDIIVREGNDEEIIVDIEDMMKTVGNNKEINNVNSNGDDDEVINGINDILETPKDGGSNDEDQDQNFSNII